MYYVYLGQGLNIFLDTPHWSVWAEWGNCGRRDDEKWRKRTRVCWYDGAPLKEWEDANKDAVFL